MTFYDAGRWAWSFVAQAETETETRSSWAARSMIMIKPILMVVGLSWMLTVRLDNSNLQLYHQRRSACCDCQCRCCWIRHKSVSDVDDQRWIFYFLGLTRFLINRLVSLDVQKEGLLNSEVSRFTAFGPNGRASDFGTGACANSILLPQPTPL